MSNQLSVDRAAVITEYNEGGSEVKESLLRLFPSLLTVSTGTVIRFHDIPNIDYMVTDGRRANGDRILLQLFRGTRLPNGLLAYCDGDGFRPGTFEIL